MHEDDLIQYGSSLLLMIIIAISARVNKIFGAVNAGAFLIYTSLFLYGLHNWSQGGSALVWWFYLVILTWIHLIGIVIYLLVKARKKVTNINN